MGLFERFPLIAEALTGTLASIVAKARPGIRFNEHIEGDGPTVFAHACKMGLEGIVSKRKGSPLSFWALARLGYREWLSEIYGF